MMEVIDAEGSSIAKLVSLDEVVGAVRPGLTSFYACRESSLVCSEYQVGLVFCLVSQSIICK